MMRGRGMRGSGGGVRGSGMRGARGMHRGGASAGGDSLYEDVYQPAPSGYGSSGGYENGSSGGGGGASGAYFEEFPEPGNDGMMGSSYNQRQSHGKHTSRLNNIGAMSSGANSLNNAHGLGRARQRAY